MKIIDLLNKIANGEAPKKIKYHDYEFRLYGGYSYKGVNEKVGFFDEIYFTELNDDVEIIEDKKIERIKWESAVENLKQANTNTNEIISKVNEIIDYINKEKE